MEGGNAGYFNANGKRKPGGGAPKRGGGPQNRTGHFSAHWPKKIQLSCRWGLIQDRFPPGVVVYEGDAFGPEYRGMLLVPMPGAMFILRTNLPPQRRLDLDLNRPRFNYAQPGIYEGYVWNGY